MTITTSIIHNLICLVNENQGSSFALPAHGWVGARATSSLAAHFALQNTLSKSAEKKASPSEGEAEGDIDIEYPLYKEGIAPNFKGDILCQYPLPPQIGRAHV